MGHAEAKLWFQLSLLSSIDLLVVVPALVPVALELASVAALPVLDLDALAPLDLLTLLLLELDMLASLALAVELQLVHVRVLLASALKLDIWLPIALVEVDALGAMV